MLIINCTSLLLAVSFIALLIYKKVKSRKKQRHNISLGKSSTPIANSSSKSVQTNQSSAKNPSQCRKPINRGGRPRGKITENKSNLIQVKKYSLNAQVVCWKEDSKWVIGIELSGALKNPTIMQDNKNLKNDNNMCCYALHKLDSSINICWDGGKETINLFDSSKQCLFFKMRKNWQAVGRLTMGLGSGYYLIITPESWTLDREECMVLQTKVEKTWQRGHKVHYFLRDNDDDALISFTEPNGERINIKAQNSFFELTGKQILDSAEEMGPLFADNPPAIQITDSQMWHEVDTIVLGEEGSGKNKWRMQFFPDLNAKKQSLPQELAERSGGWYFLRIYDKRKRLLSSLDFRFLKGLFGAAFTQPSLLPDAGGHRSVTLKFSHSKELSICLLEPKSQDDLYIKKRDAETRATIKRKPKWDMTTWQISSSQTKILLFVKIERIRWSLMEGNTIIDEQHDMPLRAEEGWFNSNSEKAIRIWLQNTKQIKKISVGFNENICQTFSIKNDDIHKTVTLSDFSASKYQVNAHEITKLIMHVTLNNDTELEIPICRVTSATLSNKTLTKKETKPKKAIGWRDKNPFEMKCCSTCDYGRVKNGIYWCKKYYWPTVTQWIFERDFARFVCLKWYGEYVGQHTSAKKQVIKK